MGPGWWHVYIKSRPSPTRSRRPPAGRAVDALALAETSKIPQPLVPSNPCTCTRVDVSSQARAVVRLGGGAPGRFFFSRRLGTVPRLSLPTHLLPLPHLTWASLLFSSKPPPSPALHLASRETGRLSLPGD